MKYLDITILWISLATDKKNQRYIMIFFVARQCKHLIKGNPGILECAINVNIIDLTKKIQVCKTTKYEGLISLALGHYLEDLNPFGSDRWSNSIRLTQIPDGDPTL
jgi:hypothetical protein